MKGGSIAIITVFVIAMIIGTTLLGLYLTASSKTSCASDSRCDPGKIKSGTYQLTSECRKNLSVLGYHDNESAPSTLTIDSNNKSFSFVLSFVNSSGKTLKKTGQGSYTISDSCELDFTVTSDHSDYALHGGCFDSSTGQVSVKLSIMHFISETVVFALG